MSWRYWKIKRKQKRGTLKNIVFAEILLNITRFQGLWQSEKMNWKIALVQKSARDYFLCKKTYIPNRHLMIQQPLPLLKEVSLCTCQVTLSIILINVFTSDNSAVGMGVKGLLWHHTWLSRILSFSILWSALPSGEEDYMLEMAGNTLREGA